VTTSTWTSSGKAPGRDLGAAAPALVRPPWKQREWQTNASFGSTCHPSCCPYVRISGVWSKFDSASLDWLRNRWSCAEVSFMGEVQFARHVTSGIDTVFAYSPDGSPAWGMELGTGRQWWYPGGDLPIVRESIIAQWASLPALPLVASSIVAPDEVVPAVVVKPVADLRSHRPGHSVLAKIAELHAASFDANGVPVLPDEIVMWSVGFVGEEIVGAELARLGPEWTTFHAVPVGARDSDIDHVVIGPAGVFSINTKHHRGINVDIKSDAVFVAGNFQPYLQAMRLEGLRAASAVAAIAPGIRVLPLLVTVGAKLRIKEMPADVVVLHHDELVGWLTSQAATVDPPTASALVAALSDASHWSASPPQPAAPEWVAELARSLATEKAVVADQRRRSARSRPHAQSAPSSRATPQVKSGRTPSRANRSKQTSGISVLVRLAVGACLLFGFVLLAPTFGRLLASTLPGSTSPSTGASSVPAAAPRLGAACAVKGAVAKDSGGHALVCAAASAATPSKLTWHKKS